MRSATFQPGVLRQLLLRNQIATLTELKQTLGTTVDVTVFRKLKELDYLTSYSHCGGHYTLREIAQFDADGLWSCQSVWFSRYGTLLATAEAFVHRSTQGYFAEELARSLHVEVQDALLELVQRRRIVRQQVSSRYLYASVDAATRHQQLLRRRAAEAIPTVANATALEVSPEELRAAILLFYSLLDEKQRRLYAGLESLKLGHGGDRQLAELLGLDAHTVSRGRQQLLAQELELQRVRRAGGGCPPVEKKRPK
jgi:hypothetical protein